MRLSAFGSVFLSLVWVASAVQSDDGPPRAPRSVTIDVLIASVPREAAPEAMTPAALLELEKAGRLEWLSRLKLATVENQKASVQIGEHAPVVTGRQSRGGFGGEAAQNVTTLVNVGTTVEALPQIAGDESIVIGLTVERSWLEPVVGSREDAPPPLPSHRTCTLTSKSTVRAMADEPTLVAGQSSSADGKDSQIWIVLKASASGKPAPDDKSAPDKAALELRVFHLKFAAAAEVAKILSSVFENVPLRISVDVRTNAILVHGPPATLEMIQALLMQLDAEQPRK